jgi:hypothetical protein
VAVTSQPHGAPVKRRDSPKTSPRSSVRIAFVSVFPDAALARGSANVLSCHLQLALHDHEHDITRVVALDAHAAARRVRLEVGALAKHDQHLSPVQRVEHVDAFVTPP